MRRYLTVFLALALALSPLSALALSPQTVYTYDFHGRAVTLRDVYQVDRTITGDAMGAGALSSPQGLYLGADGLIYLCDSGNGRILALDGNYRLVREISSFTRPDGSSDSLTYPTDLCLSSKGELYIADQRGQRIVALDKDDRMTLEIRNVISDVLQSDYQFKPLKLVLDSTDRLYVVATGVTNGVMELDETGAIHRFIGAAKVTVTLMDYLSKLVATEEQYDQLKRSIPTEYNNVALTKDDFLLGTISVVKAEDVKNAVETSMYNVKGVRIKPETLSEFLKRISQIINPMQVEAGYTVKKLNLKGNDILHRNGFQSPVGDVQFYMGGDAGEYSQGKVVTEIKASMDSMTNTAFISSTDLMGTVRGPSQFVDAAVHVSGVYSVLDQRRGRIFTYDDSGVLLYAFGGKGNAEGLFTTPTAITYRGDDVLVVDAAKGTLTVFSPTSFVLDVFSAYDAYEKGEYETALGLWRDTVKYCSNFDVGYIGAGRCLLRLERYTEAMEAFRLAQYRDGYDKAFTQRRSELIRSYLGYALIALLALIALAFVIKRLLKKRKRRERKPTRLTRFWESLAYAKRVAFHPFDGFYDLKYEGRGTVAAATVILMISVLVSVLKRQLTGFIFNANVLSQLDVMSVLTSVALPVLLFVAANWSVTTLLDGEGSVKSIYICICYALFPAIFLNLASVLLSNVLVLREMTFLSILDGAATIWFYFLLFFGIGVTHQYTVKRNVLSLLLTVVGMLMIVFIAVLFFALIEKMVSFAMTLSNEIMLQN